MKRAITTTAATTTVDTNNTVADSRGTKWLHHNNDTAAGTTLLERKIENATVGLRPEFSKLLYGIINNDALTIVDYIQAMKVETNLSDNYRKNLVMLLCVFSKFYNNNTNENKNKKERTFRTINRDDIVSFLESFRRPEPSDPMHKWIGTYNTYRIHLLRFFKWLPSFRRIAFPITGIVAKSS